MVLSAVILKVISDPTARSELSGKLKLLSDVFVISVSGFREFFAYNLQLFVRIYFSSYMCTSSDPIGSTIKITLLH